MSERSEEFDLSDLESALRELNPQPEAIDRAVLMYRAGRASARGWRWPFATMATTTLAAIFGVLLLLRPAPSVVEQIVYVPAPASPNPAWGGRQPPVAVVPAEQGADAPRSPTTPEPLDASPLGHYLQMQERILLWGLDGVPPPPPAQPLEQTPTVEQLLRSL